VKRVLPIGLRGVPAREIFFNKYLQPSDVLFDSDLFGGYPLAGLLAG
jgi:hypothetical protein